jgi:hypothetical protein
MIVFLIILVGKIVLLIAVVGIIVFVVRVLESCLGWKSWANTLLDGPRVKLKLE